MGKLESAKGELSVYEICYLILPSIPEDKVSLVTDSIRKVITKEGDTEIDSEAPFKQSLAYSMSKTIGASRYVLDDAYIGWVKFEVDKSKAQAIRADIEKIDEVLRFLMVKVPRETTVTFARARALVEDKIEKEKEDPTSSPVEDVVVK